MRKVRLIVFVVFMFCISSVACASSPSVPTSGDTTSTFSGKDISKTVDIPTSIDDPNLTSVTKASGFDTSSWCVGEDGNPVKYWSSITTYRLEISMPELDFNNMNNLRVSAKSIKNQGYFDYNAEKDVDNRIVILNVAEKKCFSGEPENANWDADRQVYICGPIVGAGCETNYNLDGKALISLSTYRH